MQQLVAPQLEPLCFYCEIKEDSFRIWMVIQFGEIPSDPERHTLLKTVTLRFCAFWKIRQLVVLIRCVQVPQEI